MEQTNSSEKELGTLTVVLPDGKVQTTTIIKPSITIGRTSKNDVALRVEVISREHARLTIDQGKVMVEDLGSFNGTFVNGKRIPPNTPTPVEPGQNLRFGNLQTSLTLPGAGTPAAPLTTGVFQTNLAMRIAKSPVRRIQVRWLLAGGFGFFGLVFLVTLLIYFHPWSLSDLEPTAVSNIEPSQPVSGSTIQDNQTPTTDTAEAFVTLTATASPPVATATQPPPTSTPPGPADTPQVASVLPASAFLELPFPYDGGNENFGGTDEQFRLASQRNLGRGTGRINSFFDHMYPLYPAPKDPTLPGGKEEPEKPIGGNILLYWGVNDPYISYTGHPGIDFSTYILHQPTTPVFAAADGVVKFVGKHGSSGALYIILKHAVPGVGDFVTIYWHLNPDTWFDQMLGSEGQPIAAGTRIGTMGNTGFSTGHHLHFEVRFDRDRNGEFPQGEAVDPYGWLPNPDFPHDPWSEKTGMVSAYLWKHPLGNVMNVPSGGGELTTPSGTGGEFPNQPTFTLPTTLIPGGTLYYTWAPDPDRQIDLIGTNNGYSFYAKDKNGNLMERFDPPLSITIPFFQDDLINIVPLTMKIYCREDGDDEWEPKETTLDLQKRIARASVSVPGQCSLMGKPTRDLALPKSIINLLADRAPDGSIFSAASLSISAFDASGIKDIFYSLDNGTTWIQYKGIFNIEPNGIPWQSFMEGDFFGGTPGTFLVLAYSVDKAGNVEDPPVHFSFGIDPSKNPAIDPNLVATLLSTLVDNDLSRLPSLDPNLVGTLVSTLMPKTTPTP